MKGERERKSRDRKGPSKAGERGNKRYRGNLEIGKVH